MRDRARDGGTGKSREEMESSQWRERSQQFFLNPGSSLALIMSSLIKSTAAQNIHFCFTVVRTSGFFIHVSPVANRWGRITLLRVCFKGQFTKLWKDLSSSLTFSGLYTGSFGFTCSGFERSVSNLSDVIRVNGASCVAHITFSLKTEIATCLSNVPVRLICEQFS